MKKVFFLLHEALALESEIQALLTLRAPIRLKYELTTLLLKLQARTKAGTECIQGLFKEFGTPDPTNPKLLLLADGTKALDDYKALQQQPVDEMEFTPIAIDAFDKLEIDFNCPVFFEKIIG